MSPDPLPLPEPPEPAPGPPALVAAVRDELARERPAASAGRNLLLLVVTLGLFAATLSKDLPATIGALVLVLFVHETGHYLGMRLFGYRDVRMFFIPFFGAAVSGRSEGAPAWQRATVLLLGPLPGIFAGLALYLVLEPPPWAWAWELAQILVLLNAFNLLPVVPLDGGRLFEVLLFSRVPALGACFRLVAVAALGWAAWWGGSVVLGVIAGLILLTTPMAYTQAVAAGRFRRAHPSAPRSAAELSDDELGDLVVTAPEPFRQPDRPPAGLAGWVRVVHEQAVSPRAGAGAVVLFLGLYTAGWAATFAYAVAVHTPRVIVVDEPGQTDRSFFGPGPDARRE